MKAVRILTLAFLTISVSGIALGQQADKTSLQITEQNEKYVLTVPVSHLVMTIPKGGLSKTQNLVGGSADSQRYFILEDRALSFIVSGWFESDDNFHGVKKLWANDMAAWK